MARPPTRTQSQRLLSSLSVAFLLLIALLCFTAPPVKANTFDPPNPDYGTVIGIGVFISLSYYLSYANIYFLQI
jgi:heat shock protein 5